MLNGVMTISEAAERYDVNQSTLKKAVIGDKYNVPLFWFSEARKSGNVWLVSESGMNRVFRELDGRIKLPEEKPDIMMLGYYDGVYLENHLPEDKLKEYIEKIDQMEEKILDGSSEVYADLASILMELDYENMKIKVPYAYVTNHKKYNIAVISMLHGLTGREFMYNTNE